VVTSECTEEMDKILKGKRQVVKMEVRNLLAKEDVQS
jgi:hypothetical protein